MASTNISGQAGNLGIPDSGTPAVTSSAGVADAAGEKIAFSGPVWFPARTGSKSIRRVAFRFGTVDKAGGSGLTVSLQNTVTGATMLRPDGTQDQTVAIANADASFASNTWYRTGTLSADRSVSFGEMLSVVVEYDGLGWQANDDFQITNTNFTRPHNHVSGSQSYTTSWGGTNLTRPNIVLEMTDGTFGTLLGGLPAKAVNTHSFDDTSNPDEYAMPFQVDVPCSLESVAFYANMTASNTTFDVKLYEGTTLLSSVAFDLSRSGVAAGNNQRAGVPLFYGTLSPSTQYYLGIKATHATDNIQIASFDVDDANHLSLYPGGTNWTYTTRNAGGSWASPTTTRRLLVDLFFGAYDDGAGGGGGMFRPVGMNGGFQ